MSRAHESDGADEDKDERKEEKIDNEEDEDEDEEALERLVFGDEAGFRESLKYSNLSVADGDDDEVDDGHTGLEGLDDADLFLVDTAPAAALSFPPYPASDTGDLENDALPWRRVAAWEDSDDERLRVSLASIPRLRKLRRTETEDVVNGKEYSRRLRQQFQMLHPAPEWARHAMQTPGEDQKRLAEEASSVDADDEVDAINALPHVAPLSALLRDIDSLIRQPGRGAGKKRELRPGVIDVQRTKDIAGVQPSPITCLSFHPQHPLLLSSGPSSTLYLHHLAPSPPSPAPNPLLTSMHIHGFPFSTTAFHPVDDRIFLSARRRYFHVWHLNTGLVEKVTRVYGHQHEQRSMECFKLSPDGENIALLASPKKGGGVINILSASTLQWISQVRIENRGGIADFGWWKDSKGLCIASKSGEVTEWSVTNERIVARWQDEGAVGTTTLALGGQHEFSRSPIGPDRWLAIGSSSGIVNVYDRRAWLVSSPPTPSDQPVPAYPTPTRTLDNLTTPTSHLTFSPDGQLLAMASMWKRDALRLVHLPSCTVFRNWPTSSTPLGRITGLACADGNMVGGDVYCLLAVANQQGRIRLWEVRT